MEYLLLKAFIPLFVAIDAIGIMPLYLSITDVLDVKKRSVILIQVIITSVILGLVFLLVGKWIFDFLGISLSDFKVAGGVLLLVISISDILTGDERRRKMSDGSSLGVVPLGTPLIIGPAVLTTLLALKSELGLTITLWAFLINILIVYLLLKFPNLFVRLLGVDGMKALSKIFHLLLAAIAVMMIRAGVIGMIYGY